MWNTDQIIIISSSELLEAEAALAVEWVLEIVKREALHRQLKKFPEPKFKYVEEEQQAF